MTKTNPSEDNYKMLVTTAIGGQANYQLNPIQLKQYYWTKVNINQFQTSDKKFQVTLGIDGKAVQTVINTEPKSFKKIKAFAADNFYSPAKANIDKVKIKTYSKFYYCSIAMFFDVCAGRFLQ